MTPVLITPPVGMVVPMVDLQAHLRVDDGFEDSVIAALHDAAVAHLDGWRGVLGRAILAQTWRLRVTGAGPHLLPMPDVIEVTATVDGDPVDIETELGARGMTVTLPDITGLAVIDFTCEMPAQLRPVADTVVKLLVGHWHKHREAVGAAAQPVPMAADMLIGAIRWRQV
jgi:uncharacterized phiE125 gp8 family phage protein